MKFLSELKDFLLTYGLAMTGAIFLVISMIIGMGTALGFCFSFPGFLMMYAGFSMLS